MRRFRRHPASEVPERLAAAIKQRKAIRGSSPQGERRTCRRLKRPCELKIWQTHKNPISPESWFRRQSKPVTTECWSCGAMRAAHYCQECGKVQPPAPVDYFSVFWAALQTESRYRSTRARLLRAEPQAASRHQRPRRRSRTGMEPGEDFATQRRLPHAERPDFADRIPASLAGRAVGRAIEGRDRRSSQDRNS